MEAQKSSIPTNNQKTKSKKPKAKNQKGQTRLKTIRVLMPKHNAVDMAMVSIESDPFGSILLPRTVGQAGIRWLCPGLPVAIA